MNLQTKKKIALCLWFPNVRYSNAFSTLSPGMTRIKSRHVSKLLCMHPGVWSRKYKPFHTPYTSAFASTQRTFTRQIEHSCSVLLFMRHAVRGTLHALTRWAFTLQAVVVFLLLGDGASSSDGPHLPRVPALCSIYEAWPCLIQPHWSQVHAKPVLMHHTGMHDG